MSGANGTRLGLWVLFLWALCPFTVFGRHGSPPILKRSSCGKLQTFGFMFWHNNVKVFVMGWPRVPPWRYSNALRSVIFFYSGMRLCFRL